MRGLKFRVLALILISGILYCTPLRSSAEGQLLTRLNLSEQEVKAEKKENISTSSLDVKRQVIAKTFRRENPALNSWAAFKFADYVLDASAKFNTDPFIIASMIIKESHVKYKAKSRSGAYGLMQITWRVHRNSLKAAFSQIKTLSDLIQPKNNILAGTYIFSCYLKSEHGNVSKALSRYLGCSGRKYRASVMKYHGKMQKLYVFHMARIGEQIS